MSVRAFELVPVIEKIQLLADKARTVIESIEFCGKNLYLGTNDSFIIHYTIDEIVQPNGKRTFNCSKQMHKYLGFKKPIQEIKAASALNRILISCDSSLILLNMYDLEPITNGPKIKGINCFSINENPSGNNPFSIQISIAKRKQLMIYNICEDKAQHLKDIHLSEPPVTMAMDGKFVCIALSTHYIIVNCETGFIQDLFPYDAIVTTPIVKRISKEEFLLNSPGALGMFVTAAGISERPPIHWLENLCAALYSHPYILAMDKNYISVYSILDQQLKQNLPFQGGILMGNFDGKLYVTSLVSVYSLIAVPWEKQVQSLLSDQRINEALELAQNSNHSGMTKEQYTKILQRIQQQAGFIEFSRFKFDEAHDLFRSSHLDVRELISLYPNMLPSSVTFTRSLPPLHSIADINQMCQGNEENILLCKKFLLRYLEDLRGTRIGQDFKQELDTALLKLYANVNSPELTTLIFSSGSTFELEDGAQWLEKFQRYNALGLFYHYHYENEKALEIWSKIVTGELQDDSFMGLEFIIEFLANLPDHDIVWKYADFIFEKDEENGVKIFTDRPENEEESPRMKPDLIVEYLHHYPSAILKYLEHLVFKKNVQKEKFHTHLALLYLDNVLQLLKTSEDNPSDLASARTKLQKLLQVSSLYRVQILLSKLEETDLYLETAILYGKLEQHEKALKILVHHLNNPEAAQEYCIRNSMNKDLKYKHYLFHTLLLVYMDSELTSSRQEELCVFAIRLLNNEAAEFDSIKVLQMIPHHWSVTVLEQFLHRILRKVMHLKWSKGIEHHLCRGENIQVKFTKYDLIREPIIMTEERICASCSCPFTEPIFARHPNGLVTHTQCSQLSEHTSEKLDSR